MNNSGYQGYGGGAYYGGGGAQQGQHQFNTNQFGHPQGEQPPGNAQQWQYTQQQQQGFGGYGQSQGGGFGAPQQQQQQQPGGFGQQQAGTFGQQPQQQQQQQQYWNPAMSAAAMGVVSQLAAGQGLAPGLANDMFTDQGKKFIENKFFPGLNTFMMTLRPYFAVDNGYVMQKIKRILFPFITKQWNRKLKGGSGPNPGGVMFDSPIDDPNAPDLYIPFMSLITYVLLCALCYGNAGQFNPEVIPDVCTKCFLCQLLEVLAIRAGFYMMETAVSFLDLWCYTGYKYLGLCVNLSIGLMGRVFALGGATAYYVCFLWTASAAAFLMLKVMSHTIPLQTAATGPKREFMVLAFAACQPLFMWFVSQTKFL